MSAAYRIEPLSGHAREGFASGSQALDAYFRERVSQDVRRRVCACFVAVGDDGAPAGFYTLAATSLLLDGLDAARRRRLPRYPLVPAVLLGRLAVSLAHQGRRLGAALVADALIRARASDVMAYAMVVEAKDEEAARFYEHLEFMRLADAPWRLFRPL